MWEFDFKVSVGIVGFEAAVQQRLAGWFQGPTTVPEDLVAGEFRCVLTGR